MNKFIRSLALVLFCAPAHEQCATAAGSRTAENRPENPWGIRVGDSLQTCQSNIFWKIVGSKEIFSRSPFNVRLSFLKPETTVVWSDERPRPNGWPTFVFGAFSDAAKTNLVDLIQVRDGLTSPLVRGSYDQALRSMARGMSVRDMYSKIGQERCDYFLDQTGRWRVQFFYSGFGSQYWIEADAATGTILEAHDGTI